MERKGAIKDTERDLLSLRPCLFRPVDLSVDSSVGDFRMFKMFVIILVTTLSSC